MALFGVIPPAAPLGQHTRNGMSAPARPNQHVKEPGPIKQMLGKLSMRERILIIALLTTAVIAIVVFLVVLPAFERITTLRNEVEMLQEAKAGIHIEPDHVPDYKLEYEAALRDYENYQHFYYPFMDPEVIDKTITDLLLDNSLEPIRLAMTQVEQTTLPLYSAARTLAPRPVPATEKPNTSETASDDDAKTDEETGDASGSADADDTGTAEENSSEEQQGRTATMAATVEDAATDIPTETTPGTNDGETAENSLIYCYTVDVEVNGWMRDFFSFLEAARGITAMEIVTYSYSDPVDPNSSVSSTKTTDGTQIENEEPKGGTIIMQIKLYVFIGGSMTTSDPATN
jgi:type II secretory pathway component PulM